MSERDIIAKAARWDWITKHLCIDSGPDPANWTLTAVTFHYGDSRGFDLTEEQPGPRPATVDEAVDRLMADIIS